MATVADILDFLNTIAPPSMAESWDRVGLNCGRSDRTVTDILVALEPMPDVCREAKTLGCQLLVTHHALIWEPGFINDTTQQGESTLTLIENGIAHINAHTNLDMAPGGVNDTLAKVLGLDHIHMVRISGTDDNGQQYGLLRQGTVCEQSLETFLQTVKDKLGCNGLRYVDAGRPVKNVAVGGGACAGEMQQVIDAGCDTFVTADVKYNQFWDAQNAGLNLIDAGHFHTENPVCTVLVQKLQKAFPDVKIHISAKHTDCAKFF